MAAKFKWDWPTRTIVFVYLAIGTIPLWLPLYVLAIAFAPPLTLYAKGYDSAKFKQLKPGISRAAVEHAVGRGLKDEGACVRYSRPFWGVLNYCKAVVFYDEDDILTEAYIVHKEDEELEFTISSVDTSHP